MLVLYYTCFYYLCGIKDKNYSNIVPKENHIIQKLQKFRIISSVTVFI